MTDILLNKTFQDGKSKSLLLCEEQNFNIILIMYSNIKNCGCVS